MMNIGPDRHSLNHKNRLPAGFTFVEMLMVVAMLSTISLAAYNTLANGLKVWEKGVLALAEQDVLLFFDKLEQDLQSAFMSSTFSVSGNKKSFRFPTLVRLRFENKDTEEVSYENHVGESRYDFINDGTGGIFRTQKGYGPFAGKISGGGEPLVRDVRDVEFKYLYFVEIPETPGTSPREETRGVSRGPTQEFWSPECLGILPAAVHVTVRWGRGRVNQSLGKTFLIPVGLGNVMEPLEGETL